MSDGEEQAADDRTVSELVDVIEGAGFDLYSQGQGFRDGNRTGDKLSQAVAELARRATDGLRADKLAEALRGIEVEAQPKPLPEGTVAMPSFTQIGKIARDALAEYEKNS